MGNAGLVLFPPNCEVVVVMYFERVFLADASRLLDDEGPVPWHMHFLAGLSS